MKQIIAAYKTASSHFTAMIQKKYRNPIQEILVPVERTNNAVCIIIKGGVYVFHPSKTYHKTKKTLIPNKPVYPKRRLTQKEHEQCCNTAIDKLMEIYRRQAAERIARGKSKPLDSIDSELYHLRRKRYERKHCQQPV